MPIHYEVDDQNRLVLVTLEGGAAVSDYANAAHRAITDPAVKSGYALLFDGRAVDPLPNVEELRALVDVARALRAHGIEPFALVAATDIQFVVGQLFATLAGAVINLETRVFRSITAAREWLALVLAKRGAAALGGLGGAKD